MLRYRVELEGIDEVFEEYNEKYDLILQEILSQLETLPPQDKGNYERRVCQGNEIPGSCRGDGNFRVYREKYAFKFYREIERGFNPERVAGIAILVLPEGAFERLKNPRRLFFEKINEFSTRPFLFFRYYI